MMRGDESRAGEAAEAFGLLANDLRMSILEALYEAREPMSFSDLSDAVEVSDSGKFNYHLGTLTDLYVRRDEEGYRLTRSGRRLLAFVFAGDVLGEPSVERSPVDRPCPRCGEPVELRYGNESLRVLCTACPGFFEGETDSARENRENPPGTISVLPLPASGVTDRTPAEILDAAATWMIRRNEFYAAGMCPTCAGDVQTALVVCPDHDPTDGLCGTCDRAIACLADLTCPTCGDGVTSAVSILAVGDPTLRSFFADHGYDLVAPGYEAAIGLATPEESLRETDPLDYELAWTLDGETLRIRMNEEPAVVEAERT